MFQLEFRKIHNVPKWVVHAEEQTERWTGMTSLTVAILEGHYTRDTDIQNHSLAFAKCDGSLPFSWSSSIPLCYISFSATLLTQLIYHHPSLHSPIHFLVYLSNQFPNSLFGGIILSSILCSCPNQHNLFNLIVCITVGFLHLRIFFIG